MREKRWSLSAAHRAAIPEWNRKWEAIIASTAPIDFVRTKAAVAAMYGLINLPPPIFVRVLSPMMAAIVGSCASVYWKHATRALTYDASRDRTDAATYNATYNATIDATIAATIAATYDTTYALTHDRTGAATNDATRAATRASTIDATNAETRTETSDVTHDATRAATDYDTYAVASAATRTVTNRVTRDATRAVTNDTAYAATYAVTRDRTYAVTRDRTYAVTYDETQAATDTATIAATIAKTNSETDDSTIANTVAVTSAVTDTATRDATRDVTHDATIDSNIDARTNNSSPSVARMMFEAATAVVCEKLGKDVTKECRENLPNWYSHYNGGSEWGSWCCFLSFVRDVVGWHHPTHDQYKHYEDAAVFGGPRFLHKRFCLLSERAAERHADPSGLPHNDSGPALRWHCGTTRYFIHGIAVDEQIVLRPLTQTVAQIDAEKNLDVRGVRIERFGWPRYIQKSGLTPIDQRRNDIEGTREALFVTKGGDAQLVVTCPTGRVVPLGVPPEVKTCAEAQHWLRGGRKVNVIART